MHQKARFATSLIAVSPLYLDSLGRVIARWLTDFGPCRERANVDGFVLRRTVSMVVRKVPVHC